MNINQMVEALNSPPLKPRKSMKTFEVELRRTSFITVTVQAENEDDAEALAYKQIESEGGDTYADWETESIEEVSK